MPLRAALLAAAVLVIAYGALGLREHNRCEDARTAIAFAAVHPRDAGARADLPAQERRLEASCDTQAIATASTQLTFAGRPREAAALADRATRTSPRSFDAWVAFGQALERSDPRAAAAARRQALALNPLGPVPRAGGAGAARRPAATRP